MNDCTSSRRFDFWFALTLGIGLGLACGLNVAHLTGDFISPPLLGAAFGGAVSTTFDL
jgi:hypothetical protein